METCTNCTAELAPGEAELCYPCANANPQERARRHRVNLPVIPQQVKQHVDVLNSQPMTAERRLQLALHSGEKFSVTRMVLFPEPHIRETLRLKAKAREELAGFSSGLSFWGSPEYVIGGGMALEFVESLVSNSKAKKGMEIMAEAKQQQAFMRSRGVLFSVHEIAEIWQPDPSLWFVIKPGENPEDEPTPFIHSGDEFVWLESDGLISAVRWSSIDSYKLV